MSDHPDIYADGFSITAGPFGVTVTLALSQPTGEPGPHEDPSATIARLRFSRELAQKLAEGLAQMLAASTQGGAPSSSISALAARDGWRIRSPVADWSRAGIEPAGGQIPGRLRRLSR